MANQIKKNKTKHNKKKDLKYRHEPRFITDRVHANCGRLVFVPRHASLLPRDRKSSNPFRWELAWAAGIRWPAPSEEVVDGDWSFRRMKWRNASRSSDSIWALRYGALFSDQRMEKWRRCSGLQLGWAGFGPRETRSTCDPARLYVYLGFSKHKNKIYMYDSVQFE